MGLVWQAQEEALRLQEAEAGAIGGGKFESPPLDHVSPFLKKGNFAKGNFYECEPQNYNTRMPWGASIVRIIYVKQNIYKLNTMRRGSGEPSQPVMTFRGARKYLSKRYLSIILSIISSGDHTKAKESCHRERTES